jgi:hypothetical protein
LELNAILVPSGDHFARRWEKSLNSPLGSALIAVSEPLLRS